MATKRKIEIFSAGCPVCQEAVKMVQNLTCSDCEVNILDMNDPAIASRAKGALKINSKKGYSNEKPIAGAF
jgi:hypothetical protein